MAKKESAEKAVRDIRRRDETRSPDPVNPPHKNFGNFFDLDRDSRHNQDLDDAS
jgi:hypothetical protein